jgi:hypothetical protein
MANGRTSICPSMTILLHLRTNYSSRRLLKKLFSARQHISALNLHITKCAAAVSLCYKYRTISIETAF